MQKKLTITLAPEVYSGLHSVIGRGNISGFIERLVRPHVTLSDLEEGYRQLAEDKDDQREWRDWADRYAGVTADEPW